MILLNALRGVHARVTLPRTGAWTADVDVDLEAVPVVPTGRAILTLGTTVLSGTIDARATGRFGNKAKIRLVAGGGGWDTPVPALSLDNDAGVFSAAVYAVTAATVGESPVVEAGAPRRLGVHYARMRGPASQVFAGVDWWVDLAGITHAGARTPSLPPDDIDILTWDPTSKVAVIASGTLLTPGMTLTDVRFGTAVIDDVEHTFSDDGARAIAWCSTPSLLGVVDPASDLAAPSPTAGAKVVRALGALARHAAGASTLKTYAYRLVTQGPDGRMNLQATTQDGESPQFLKLIDVWAGVPGASVKLAPASVVLVRFTEGDRSRPCVVGFDPDAPTPLEVKLDAVRIAFGVLPVDPVARSIATLAAVGALQAQVAAMAAAWAALGALTGPILGALVAPIAAPVAAAVGTGTAAVATASAQIPSTKVFTE